MRLAIFTASGSGRGRTLFSSSLKRLAFQIFHHDVRPALLFDGQNLQDVGMVELEADLLLAAEAVEAGGIALDLEVRAP